jgi:hypothetical protein
MRWLVPFPVHFAILPSAARRWRRLEDLMLRYLEFIRGLCFAIRGIFCI